LFPNITYLEVFVDFEEARNKNKFRSSTFLKLGAKLTEYKPRLSIRVWVLIPKHRKPANNDSHHMFKWEVFHFEKCSNLTFLLGGLPATFKILKFYNAMEFSLISLSPAYYTTHLESSRPNMPWTTFKIFNTRQSKYLFIF
jgi:hypothetical protein